MKKNITIQEYENLKAYMGMINLLKMSEEEVEGKCSEILGMNTENVNYNFLFDYLFNDAGGIDEMLDQLGVQVKK